MNLPRPMNNNVLVLIEDEFSAVKRDTANESQKKGRIVDFHISRYHITASSAIQLEDKFLENLQDLLGSYVKAGAPVYWEEFANEGQMFTINDTVIDKDGVETTVARHYAFVAWWRLTGIEMPEGSK